MENDLFEDFEESAIKIKESNIKLDNDDLLLLYGLYKQSTEGDCNIDKPYFYDFKGTAKYNAWKENEGMTKEKAMKNYIKKVKKFLK